MKLLRMVLVLTAAVCICVLSAARKAGAEHFGVLVRVSADGNQVSATMDTSPPPQGYNPRPVIEVQTGDPVVVDWHLINQYPHGGIPHVGVHFFVVKEKSVGQKEVPSLTGSGLVLDDQFMMDFAKHAEAKGRVKFRAGAPGIYLVRLQSENTSQQFGHEHFGAIDLKVTD